MTAAEKHAISHRGRAFRALAEALDEQEVAACRCIRRAEMLILPMFERRCCQFTPDSDAGAAGRRWTAATSRASRSIPCTRSTTGRFPGRRGDDPGARLPAERGDRRCRCSCGSTAAAGCTGNLDTHDQLCRLLVRRRRTRSSCRSTTGSRPRRSFPAAVDDCVAAWTWVAAHAAELGGDPHADRDRRRQRGRQPRRGRRARRARRRAARSRRSSCSCIPSPTTSSTARR